LKKRGSGILLHITSLPSAYGIGDFGPDAYSFADFLSETNQSYWQILPLNLTCRVYGNSPYSSFSAFAGNYLLVSPDRMVKDGLIDESDIKDIPDFPGDRVDYASVIKFKEGILKTTYAKNKDRLSDLHEFQRFCTENADWLDDYCLFITIKAHLNDAVWSQWPEELRDRQNIALSEWNSKMGDEILRNKFYQFIFFNQWYALKNYCDSKDIKLIGDIPIYVNYDSADVWANPKIFNLDNDKNPAFVAGVPPDYFSSTGQLWGHPVYRWDVLKKSRYAWWLNRIRHNLKLFHLFRLDHFRGFVGYWEIKASEKSAISGKWVEAPAEDFFNTLLSQIPDISIIAEDLGVITDDVREIMAKFQFPGMKVLLFAFGEDMSTNPYAPHNHIRNCVIYTGTHDNNTIRGWFKKELGPEARKRISDYIGREITEKNVHWEIIRLAMMSVADLVIIPMQDILGLGEKERMNIPASANENWEWRLLHEQLTPPLIKKLSDMTRIYGR
jgi:4-alpha-glucanotransferase